MSFTTLPFILLFIVCICLYYLPGIRDRQWALLLLASMVFYGWNAPWMLVFLLLSIVTTWAFSLKIHKLGLWQSSYLKSQEASSLSREEKKACKAAVAKRKKGLLLGCLLANLGILVIVKYASSATALLSGITQRPINTDWIIMPLGISFYTFQSIGYVIDVYREVEEPQKNLARYALYVSFFPQICQGPIGRYSQLNPQLYRKHDFDYDTFVRGLERILLGFFKKLVVADRLGLFIHTIYSGSDVYSGPMLLFATLMYAFQLYADFSGYMDIAIGISSCFGIRLQENFKTPYFSRNIAEFWRRWHISLGSWFRDYLYYSLLRSSLFTRLGKSLTRRHRKKLAHILTTSLALSVTWLTIGIWHGSTLNFLLHGIYHGFFVVMAVVLADVYDSANTLLRIPQNSFIWKGFQMLRTFTIVTMGYVLFRSSGISQAMQIYGRIFGFTSGSASVFDGIFEGGMDRTRWLLVLVMLVCLLVIEVISEKKDFFDWLHQRKMPVRWAILYLLGASVLLFGAWNSYNGGNFLYFDF